MTARAMIGRLSPVLWLAAVAVLALTAWAGATIVANAGVDIVLPRWLPRG